jgi:hypothetical protein
MVDAVRDPALLERIARDNAFQSMGLPDHQE